MYVGSESLSFLWTPFRAQPKKNRPKKTTKNTINTKKKKKTNVTKKIELNKIKKIKIKNKLNQKKNNIKTKNFKK